MINLANTGDQELAGPILSALSEDEHGNARSRSEIARELVYLYIGGNAIRQLGLTSLFIDALNDEDPQVRAVAVTVLGDVATQDVIPPLTNALEDPDRRVRRNAARALERLG